MIGQPYIDKPGDTFPVYRAPVIRHFRRDMRPERKELLFERVGALTLLAGGALAVYTLGLAGYIALVGIFGWLA